MTNDPRTENRIWLVRLLAVPLLAVVLIVIIVVAQYLKPKYPATLRGELLSVREDALEVEGYGLIPLDPGCSGYLAFESEEEYPLSFLPVGSGNLEFDTKDDAIIRIRETEKLSVLPVRVLLMTRDFKERFHESITLSCDSALVAEQNGSVYSVPAGESITFCTGDEALADGRLILTPEDGAEITVVSLSRAYGNPSYPGRLEILDTDEGLVLINETDMETYLTRVVPSEMEEYFQPEALKAQAVCARTYAYTQQRENTYFSLGAQLDDSTNFQVYNNSGENAAASEAVYATEGELILYEGKPIQAFYFSTSCGNTTDGSLWGMDPEQTPYLKSVALQPDRRTFDWSDEDEFAAFIKRQDVSAYDSDSPYFRWRMDITSDFLETSFDDIGSVTDISVTERGAGGAALSMRILGTEGEAEVEGQYAIREALCDTSSILTRNDGSFADSLSALPSSFLYIEPMDENEDGIRHFMIYGGGYGHGVGMSQNGAQGMAKDGMDYREILKFFYDGVNVDKILQ